MVLEVFGLSTYVMSDLHGCYQSYLAMLIQNNPRPGYIYQANNHIAIDCGRSFLGGRLACLRLEDMKEFYIETEE